MTTLKAPTAYSILFALIAVVAGLTSILPAGEYERVHNEALGKEVPVQGTYREVAANRQGITDVLMAPIAGMYDPESYEARAIDVALFVLIIGGFLGVVNRTQAMDAGIKTAMNRLQGREQWMIPIGMALFAAGGTIYGMGEETLAFYTILIPVLIAAGYDAVTGVAVIMIGAGIGTLGSTVNPFATVIASNAAGVAFVEGLALRFIILVLGWLTCVIYVMRYAERVRKDPARSLVADRREENEAHFLRDDAGSGIVDFTRCQKMVLLVFGATFVVMVWGISSAGWWMGEMSALFLTAAVIVAIIARLGEEEFTVAFIDGARDLLGVALIVGLARGIVALMDAGKITDTVLHWSAEAASHLSSVAFVNGIFGLELVLSFFVPSSSGLAILTMPILAPLADFCNVDRHLVVTAYQSANGLANLVNPTFAVVMGGLALGRVPYQRWLRFMGPLLLMLALIIVATLSLGVFL